MAEVLEFNEMFYTNFEPKMKNRFIMEIDGIPTYLIKTAAVSSEGTSSYSGTSSIFLSAYGYRFALSGANVVSTAITTAARYTGNTADSVVVSGTTYQNWKQVENIKRYVSDTGGGSPGWIDLVQ